MSEIQKSYMTVDGNHINLSMPFAKVDKAQRTVSGFATLDNIDTQGDVVLAEASAKAFARARGNLREMHQPIAVGKVVDFHEQEFFADDPKTGEGKFYRGIFVTARVSEGAEDTWKKVLDETLTGFSIGGEINDVSNEFVKEAGQTIRFIKDYDLVELSLVDNPANQLANVFSIQKAANGSVTVQGMAAETVIETVFICKNDDTVVVKQTDSEECPMCGTKMENAGWFEAGKNRAEKVSGIVAKFLHPAEKEAAPTESKGGVEVEPEEVTKASVPEAKETSVPNPSETTPTGEKIEDEAKATVEDENAAEVDETEGTDEEEASAESPDEVHDEEDEIAKKMDNLHDAIKKSLDESKEETLEKVKDLETKIDTAIEKASELEKKFEEFGPKLTAQKERLAALENRLEKMNSSDAIKKSASVQPAEQNVQKDDSFWGGAFSD